MSEDEPTDYRKHPQQYRIGRGEEGVFHVEPYKSELLPLWAFRTSAVARASAEAIYQRYLVYREVDDFVGMDMARKYLQMGYTRARRYTNHLGGRKYATDGSELPRSAPDPEKAEAAAIFKQYWQQVTGDPVYVERKVAHQRKPRRPGDQATR